LWIYCLRIYVSFLFSFILFFPPGQCLKTTTFCDTFAQDFTCVDSELFYAASPVTLVLSCCVAVAGAVVAVLAGGSSEVAYRLKRALLSDFSKFNGGVHTPPNFKKCRKVLKIV
jgi:hypothetical protein